MMTCLPVLHSLNLTLPNFQVVLQAINSSICKMNQRIKYPDLKIKCREELLEFQIQPF